MRGDVDIAPSGICKECLRAVGEIGEALPVAEEASRFRGSAPIGGHDSDRKSVGTTVGKRTPPLRRGYKECDAGRNPPGTASPCQPPLGKGAERTGDADCHSRCAHRLRNDMVFARSRYKASGRTGADGPMEALQEVQWAGDRKGRPYGGPQEGVVRRADVGIGPYGVFTDRIL